MARRKLRKRNEKENKKNNKTRTYSLLRVPKAGRFLVWRCDLQKVRIPVLPNPTPSGHIPASKTFHHHGGVVPLHLNLDFSLLVISLNRGVVVSSQAIKLHQVSLETERQRKRKGLCQTYKIALISGIFQRWLW